MARRFDFRLETLLRVRALHEREAQRKLAAKQAEIARIDQVNELTRREVEREQAALRNEQLRGTLEPSALTRGRAWVAHLRQTMAQRQAAREQLMAELGELRGAYREARKQRRIIEKLRERRWDEYRRAQERRETAEAAELAQQMHLFARCTADAPRAERDATSGRGSGASGVRIAPGPGAARCAEDSERG